MAQNGKDYNMSTEFEVISGGAYPSDPVVGQCVYNDDTDKPEWWSGSAWTTGSGVIEKEPNIKMTMTEFGNLVKPVFPTTGTNYYTSYSNIEFIITEENKVILVDYNYKLTGAPCHGIVVIGNYNTETHNFTFDFGANPTLISYNSKYANFGTHLTSISYTQDASVVAVAATGDRPVANLSNEGSVTVFDFNESGLIKEQLLISQVAPGITSTYYGCNVSLSEDGLMIVIGTYGPDIPVSNCNTVEVWERTSKGEDFTYTGNIVPSIPTSSYSTNYYWGGNTAHSSIHITSAKDIFVGCYSDKNAYNALTKVVKATSNGDGTFAITEYKSLTNDNMAALGAIVGVGISTSSIIYEGVSISVDEVNNKLYVTNRGYIFNSNNGGISEYDIDTTLCTNNFWVVDNNHAQNPYVNSRSNMTNNGIPFNDKFLVHGKHAIGLDTFDMFMIIDKNSKNTNIPMIRAKGSGSYTNLNNRNYIIEYSYKDSINSQDLLAITYIGDLY